MDRTKLSDVQRLQLCRRFFFVGIACLPLVWLMNAVWFLPDAFRRPQHAVTPSIRRYVLLSAIGCVAWIVLVAVWESIYQFHRSRGEPWADALTFVFPRGRL